MKIAFSGSAGTGKTTLAKKISEIYKFKFIPEGIREYLSEQNIEHLRELNPNDSFVMQKEILKRKLSLENENLYNNFVADRSTADNLAYTLRWCSRNISEEEIRDYYMKCLDNLRVYDIVFFCPWNSIELENDSIRSNILFYQYEISMLIYGIIKSNNIPMHVLETSSLQDRLIEIQDILTLY